MTLGLGVTYLKNWQADIAYTAYFGGRTYSGTDVPNASPALCRRAKRQAMPAARIRSRDRDFLSMSVSYAF